MLMSALISGSCEWTAETVASLETLILYGKLIFIYAIFSLIYLREGEG